MFKEGDWPGSDYNWMWVSKKSITAVWQKEWAKEKRGSIISIYRQVWQRSSVRRHTVVMMRLRLGHCGLAWDLWKMWKHEDGQCGTRKQQQTVIHTHGAHQFQRKEISYVVVKSACTQTISVNNMLNPSESQPSFTVLSQSRNTSLKPNYRCGDTSPIQWKSN